MTLARLTRYAWVLVAAWTAAILGSAGWNSIHTLSETRDLALSETRAHLIQERAFNLWSAGLGGVYAPVTAQLQPNPLLDSAVDRDILTPSGKQLTLVPPHFMLPYGDASDPGTGGIHHHLTSLKPKNPAVQPDDWQHAALTAFTQGEAEYREFKAVGGKPLLRLMQPLITERHCLPCHAQQGYRVGDIRGGLEAETNLAPYYDAAHAELWAIGATHAVLWLLGLLAISSGARRIARRTAERDRAEQERRRLEAQIQQSQKLESLGVLAGGIAHEFNNLLTGILGHASLAREILPPGSPAQPLLLNAERAALRAADLTRQMLACSGKGHFIVESTDLNLVVEELSHSLARSSTTQFTWQCNCAAQLPAIEVDRDQLRQVIMSLLSNAAEAIGDRPGHIAISTGLQECDPANVTQAWPHDPPPAGTYVYFEVTDTGCGMDQATLRRIFDPFFTTKFVGRGLGLAAVLGIVRGHRGVIQVHSTPGQGTTFRVLFPRSERVPAFQPAEPALQAATRPTGTVLIVDDEPEVLEAASLSLDRFGFKVLTARDGREAVELFRARRGEIDIVLLDLTMPHVSGAEVYRELRRTSADVRVILSSGYSEQEAFASIGGGRPVGFIQKPYRASALAQKLRDALVA